MATLFPVKGIDDHRIAATTTTTRWMTVALVASIFIGNAHVGITFPVAIIPASFLLATSRPSIPIGAGILGLLMLPLLLQSLTGAPLQDRSDLVLYLPFLYAAACASAIRPIQDGDVYAALMAGGAALSALMLASLAHRLAAGLPSSLSELKTAIDIPLGHGNYLAAFLVFLFNAALHRRSPLAALFAALTLATFSRIGASMLAVSAVFFVIVARLGVRRFFAALTVFGIASLVACVVIYAAASHSIDFTQASSIGVRMMMWRDAIDAITYHPIVGAPRSWYVAHLNFGYAWDFTFGAWNPHNFILAVWMLFGIVGVAIFAAFLVVVIRSVSERARISETWRGVLVGLVVLLAWSLFEDLLLNSSVLILVATIYGLARDTHRRSGMRTLIFTSVAGAAALTTCNVGGTTIFKQVLTAPAPISFEFGSGWRHYTNEKDHGGARHWSDGEWSTINVQFPEAPSSARFAILTFDAVAYVAHPFKDEQRVSVYLDGREVSSARLRSAGVAEFRAFIPIQSISGDLTLKIRSWTPTEAREFGIDADLGRTAVGIKDIRCEFVQ